MRTVVYMSDSAMPPPIPNPRTEDWGWVEMGAIVVVVTPRLPKATAIGDEVVAIPAAAAVEPGRVASALAAFTTTVLVYRDSSTLFRAVCRLASLLATT